LKDATLAILVIMVVAVVIGSSSLYVMNADPCLITECNATATTITVGSVTLFSGVTASNSSQAIANLFMTINNPGKTTYVSSLSLSGAWAVNNDANTTHEASTTTSESVTSIVITTWQDAWNSTSAIIFSTDFAASELRANHLTPMTFYPRTSSPENILQGERYNFAINFTNGESISGSLIAV